MSRSYKKTPVSKDHSKFYKKYANKVVRRTKNIPNGKAYKKMGGDSWDICDWKWYCTEKEFIKNSRKHDNWTKLRIEAGYFKHNYEEFDINKEKKDWFKLFKQK